MELDKIISKNDIRFEKLKLPYEVCGEITVKNKTENYILRSTGPSTGRRQCQLQRNYKGIWHTHPNISKAYPSVEDLLKPIKHSTIISKIFTEYGTWTIHCGVKYDYERNKDKLDVLKQKLRHINDVFYSLVYKNKSKDKLKIKTQIKILFFKNLNEYEKQLKSKLRKFNTTIDFKRY